MPDITFGKEKPDGLVSEVKLWGIMRSCRKSSDILKEIVSSLLCNNRITREKRHYREIEALGHWELRELSIGDSNPKTAVKEVYYARSEMCDNKQLRRAR